VVLTGLGVAGAAALLIAITSCVVTGMRHGTLYRPGLLLLLAAALAIASFAFTMDWLAKVDPGTRRGDDIRTAGVAAAAILALYGLWLNDRRRRTDEDRNDTERKRYELEGERTAGERFARAIELLGNPDEAVKLGALHSLATLGKGRSDLVQPVLDVLCAYLRMPVERCDPADVEQSQLRVDRLMQVRQTAQRLIPDLLPPHDPADATGPDYRLDLAGAVLHKFTLAGVALGSLDLTGASCDGPTVLDGLRITGELVLTSARFSGRVSAQRSTVARLVATDEVFFGQPVDLSDAVIGESSADLVCLEVGLTAHKLIVHRRFRWRMRARGAVDLGDATFHGGLDIAGTTCTGRVILHNVLLGPGSTLDNVTFAAIDLRLGEPLPVSFASDGLRSSVLDVDIQSHSRLDWQEMPGQPRCWRIRVR
jgi:hypothetical protein